MDSFESIGEELSDIEISLLEKYIDDIKASLPRPQVLEEKSVKEIVDLQKVTTKKEVIDSTQKVVEKVEPILQEIDDVELKQDEIESTVNNLEPTDETISVAELDEVENPIADISKNSSNPNLDALFVKAEVKELSDQLKWKPIKDIDKSLSINERILTKNELFDGDGELMNATIATLNSFKSYDEAINYLKNNIALKLDWASDSKKGKAALFLQKVQRRYM